MTGIVVVSHSRALARAAVDLATEMAGGAPPCLQVAAGLDERTTGTDATAVAEALSAADDGHGVLVLVDLGSALLSTELALELVEPELARRVRVSSAPLVEGLVAAVVAAMAGGGPEELDAEARDGLRAKEQHLARDEAAGQVEQHAPVDTPAGPAPDAAGELVLQDPHGLHSRPAARFARLVAAHPQVRVEVLDQDGPAGPADGRSMSALAALGARQGHRLRLAAWGPGSQELLGKLQAAAADGFAAEPTAPSPEEQRHDRGGQGPVGTGVPEPGTGLEAALGPSRRGGNVTAGLTGYRAGPAQKERTRLESALAAAGTQLSRLVTRTRETVGPDEAAVLEAHLELLADPALLEPAREAISRGEPAPQAWRDQVTRVSGQLSALADPYQRERARDILEVGTLVLQQLVKPEQPALGDDGLRPPGVQAEVLVVDELDVATATTMDGAAVAGVVAMGGSATGHGVLLARARRFPVVTGAGRRAEVADGTLLGLESRSQQVHVDPDEQTRQQLAQLIESRRVEREHALAVAHEPGRTADGVRIAVEANLGVVAEVGPAVAGGAEGCGLLRTEVLFARERHVPTVAEQVEALTAVAEALRGRPLTVRTWDVGGDKPLPFLPVPAEANPFLGARGLRASRAAPELLVDQLEAVCRLAVRHPVRVMFPMVTTSEEVAWALARLDEAAGRLTGGRPERLQVGVMVEVPAAALRVTALSAGLDFLSVGSNDLTQYLLAAERGNPALQELADQADPAVLRLVHIVCQEAPVPVVVCGEAASDPELAAVLVGLGVRELSATAATIPAVKAMLRRHRLADLEALATRARGLGSAAEVRRLLGSLRG